SVWMGLPSQLTPFTTQEEMRTKLNNIYGEITDIGILGSPLADSPGAVTLTSPS
ncbi:hypothetical protein SK128_007770, partial [Halocaridina rubra]